MKQKKDDFTNLTWISRFWAQYSKLPESFKDGFYSLVINISKEINKKEIVKRSAVNEGNC